MGDIEDITALVNSYAELLDAGDFDAVAALFADATWRAEMTGQVLRGAAEVRRVYDRVALYDGSPRTKHLMTNLTIEVRPDGTAGGRCYFTVLQGIVPGEPIQVVLSGRYVDEYRKVDGRWRFSDRLFVADIIGDQSRHFR
jgi:ketosteroid isomerase-like protein